jgi:RNA polymerase-interacting CarD/CdnL/TRCF family regulator
MEAKNREDFFCERFSREYITGIIQKNERFIHSKKTVTAFMLEESINKKQGKKHLEIRRQQMMRQWYEKGDFAKINELLAELEERKNAPPREGESSRFYRNAVEFHEMLKGKRGRKKRQKTKA